MCQGVAALGRRLPAFSNRSNRFISPRIICRSDKRRVSLNRQNCRRSRRRANSPCQLHVIGSFRLATKQAHSHSSQLIQNYLRRVAIWASLERPNMGHLPVTSTGDHVKVIFECPDAQQPVMVRRLFVGWNPEPKIVGVKIVHSRQFSVRGGQSIPPAYRKPSRGTRKPNACRTSSRAGAGAYGS